MVGQGIMLGYVKVDQSMESYVNPIRYGIVKYVILCQTMLGQFGFRAYQDMLRMTLYVNMLEGLSIPSILEFLL